MKEVPSAGEDTEQRVLEDIEKARLLYTTFGDALIRDGKIGALLARYQRAVAHTASLMQRLGVSAKCTVCATQGPGSCCFQGIEAGYNPMLLLINLLLGCAIPSSPDYPESCRFVGDKGCKLTARYYFCIHYLCPDLREYLGEDLCRELLSTVGEELSTGWELEQTLHQWFTTKCPL